MGIRVKYDNADNKRPGFKFAALADGGLHSVDDVNLSGIPTERTAHLLQQMVEDGEAEVVNGKYRKHS